MKKNSHQLQVVTMVVTSMIPMPVAVMQVALTLVAEMMKAMKVGLSHQSQTLLHPHCDHFR